MANDSQANARARYVALAVLALVFTTVSAPSVAQNWSIEPLLAAGYEHDDNAQLSVRTDDIVQLNGVLAEARADFRYESAQTNFVLTPIVLHRDYSDESEFSSTKAEGIISYEYESPRHSFVVDGRFDRDKVRNAERVDQDIDEEDPDNIPNDDTGLVLLAGDRNRWSLRPAWTYRLTDVSTTKVQLEHRDVTYDDVLFLLSDYSDTTFLGNYQRRLTSKVGGFVNAGLRTYEQKESGIEFDNTRVDVGINWQVSEKLRLIARAGLEDVELSGSGMSESVTIGELTLIRRLETIRLLAQYRRSVGSGGAGRMSTRDAFNLNLTRQLTERFATGLGVRAYTAKPVDFGGGSVDELGRDFVQLTGRFTWNLTASLAFETSYRHTILSREIEGESANSNQIVARFIYQPQRTTAR